MSYYMFLIYLAVGLVAGYIGKFYLGLDVYGVGLLCLGSTFIAEGVKRNYYALLAKSEEKAGENE